MLKPDIVNTVKATAPAVEEHAEQVTRRFYVLMFVGNPQVRGFSGLYHWCLPGDGMAVTYGDLGVGLVAAVLRASGS